MTGDPDLRSQREQPEDDRERRPGKRAWLSAPEGVEASDECEKRQGPAHGDRRGNRHEADARAKAAHHRAQQTVTVIDQDEVEEVGREEVRLTRQRRMGQLRLVEETPPRRGP